MMNFNELAKAFNMARVIALGLDEQLSFEGLAQAVIEVAPELEAAELPHRIHAAREAWLDSTPAESQNLLCSQYITATLLSN